MRLNIEFELTTSNIKSATSELDQAYPTRPSESHQQHFWWGSCCCSRLFFCVVSCWLIFHFVLFHVYAMVLDSFRLMNIDCPPCIYLFYLQICLVAELPSFKYLMNSTKPSGKGISESSTMMISNNIKRICL